jgi:hypothetical protein
MESIRTGPAIDPAAPTPPATSSVHTRTAAVHATPDFDAIESALDGFLSEGPAPPRVKERGPRDWAHPARTTAVPLTAPASRSDVPMFGADEERPAEPATASPSWEEPASRLTVWHVVGSAGSRRRKVVVLGLVGAVVVSIPLVTALYRGSAPFGALAASSSASADVVSGTATFQSNPSGAAVSIGGSVRGTTPLKLSLPVGDHIVEIGDERAKRQLTAAISANTVASYYVELAAAEGTLGVPARNGATGGLEIVSDPAGATVSIDGVARGVAPLTLTNVEAGEHRVTLSQDGTTTNRTVRVAPGAMASVVASTRASQAEAGWVTISAPFEMKIFEAGALIGTTASERIMLPAGTHTFNLRSEELEFNTSVPVRVTPGKTATAAVRVPTGLLSVNALPWAEVLVDGQSVGTTPLGNLVVPIGSREVVWRHPQFGERRRVVTVKERTPVRIGVDFSQ